LFALAGCKWPGPIWIPSNLNLDRKREAQTGLLHRPGAPEEFVRPELTRESIFDWRRNRNCREALLVLLCACFVVRACGGTEGNFGQARL
jgi:hypothetical protein